MKIESFWVKGFRSLADVRLDGLGQFNVFYGPNGAGKSNILEALRLFARILEQLDFRVRGQSRTPGFGMTRPLDLGADDQCRFGGSALVLGARIVASPADWWNGPLQVELQANWSDISPSRILEGVASIEQDGQAMMIGGDDPQQRNLLEGIRSLGKVLYGGVPADRAPRRSKLSGLYIDDANDVQRLLTEGRLTEALHRARLHQSSQVRRRYVQFAGLLTRPPFDRPTMETVVIPPDGVELRELLPAPNPERLDVPLDLAGLGVAQVYAIVAHIALGGRRTVGIEEPEAHLHARTSGKQLREALVKMVDEGFVDQLFIATHSNLFDLDPTGYFDVMLEKGVGTKVTRQPLSTIDDHLYEPGPAKRALRAYLELLDPQAIVFRRDDGTPIGIQEMIGLLETDDAIAFKFLDDVHAAAVRTVRVQQKKPAA